ncbi:MAG: nitric-oxide reductase large subunit [Chloroflexi bacterium]|nr:nitric-oxide reductase large subunit [Chloroflexota bacterium]
MVFGFSILIFLAIRTYADAPPIPDKVIGPGNEIVFTGADVQAGQQVFLKYGLMENGTVWGHGAYLGPDFSALYLHTLDQDTDAALAEEQYSAEFGSLNPVQRDAIHDQTEASLKQNRYDEASKTLTFTAAETNSYRAQVDKWKAYFSKPTNDAGLSAAYIDDPQELKQLTAFFSWAAWASVANRPDKAYSYTNNFPYDPAVGNTPTTDALVWSALSLIALLGGTALVLFAFGRFDFLGWKGKTEHVHPQMLPGVTTPSQRGAIKFFVVVALLFLVQTLVGTATAHYRADPATFYGIDLTSIFPSNIVRTWHVQLAIFWIAAAYIAGALFLAPALGKGDPKGQTKWMNVLFVALVIVVGGSLLGELLGIRQLLGNTLWFWLGDQGWEYLDLGRLWQILLAIGLVLWLGLLFRAIAPARKDPKQREISSLFLYAAAGIPLFYIPAMFFDSTTNYAVVDMWRFWIIHLWVEGFFELFVTAMVALIFYQLGIVTQKTALRVVYLDAILYLGSGIVGTGHHWYWTGQSTITMALGATFSALEIVPLTLLTLDAWDFIKLTRGKCDVCGQPVSIPHKWTFYFLMAVGFWNFLGAGVFGFLINLPIVSYYEVGTMLTANHGHAALMGVFGMLGVALTVFAMRQVVTEKQWARVEKFIRLSFWGLNVGLGLMVVTSLFPGGVMQLTDVLNNGYWHARSFDFLTEPLMRTLEWVRLPGDTVFLVLGVLPLVIAALMTYWFVWKPEPKVGASALEPMTAGE